LSSFLYVPFSSSSSCSNTWDFPSHANSHAFLLSELHSFDGCFTWALLHSLEMPCVYLAVLPLLKSSHKYCVVL
jgi:hypothetical protein